MTQQRLLQDEQELAEFVELLRGEGVGSYLEVGSKYGESLRRIACALKPGSRIVAIDLPRGTKHWRNSEPALTAAIADLKRQGFDASVIWGDSTSPAVIDRVRTRGPFDAILIDANHTMPYLTKDWTNYGPMGRIVAFHDISWHRAQEWCDGIRIEVPQFWNEIKNSYRHKEIRYCPTGKDNGIGVLWR